MRLACERTANMRAAWGYVAPRRPCFVRPLLGRLFKPIQLAFPPPKPTRDSAAGPARHPATSRAKGGSGNSIGTRRAGLLGGRGQLRERIQREGNRVCQRTGALATWGWQRGVAPQLSAKNGVALSNRGVCQFATHRGCVCHKGRVEMGSRFQNRAITRRFPSAFTESHRCSQRQP
jgi:hypothetical protein